MKKLVLVLMSAAFFIGMQNGQVASANSPVTAKVTSSGPAAYCYESDFDGVCTYTITVNQDPSQPPADEYYIRYTQRGSATGYTNWIQITSFPYQYTAGISGGWGAEIMERDLATGSNTFYEVSSCN